MLCVIGECSPRRADLSKRPAIVFPAFRQAHQVPVFIPHDTATGVSGVTATPSSCRLKATAREPVVLSAVSQVRPAVRDPREITGVCESCGMHRCPVRNRHPMTLAEQGQ